jgi:hypothetical protein
MDPQVAKHYAILFPNFTFDRLLLLWWKSRRDSKYPASYSDNITIAMQVRQYYCMIWSMQCGFIKFIFPDHYRMWPTIRYNSMTGTMHGNLPRTEMKIEAHIFLSLALEEMAKSWRMYRNPWNTSLIVLFSYIWIEILTQLC